MPATSRAQHPNGSVIIFTEEDHKYVIESNPYLPMVSSTTFIHHYFPEFDSEAVSMKVAKKQNPGLDAVNLAEIAATLRGEWKAKADKSCSFGTRVHEVCEDFMLDKYPRNQPETQKELTVMNRGYDAVMMLKAKGWKLIAVELIIFSEKYGVCGTVDLIMFDPVNNIYWILDWKTNEAIKFTDKWEKGLKPIQHLQNCNAIHYMLQLNLYQRLIVDEGYAPEGAVFKRAIIHLTENNKPAPISNPEFVLNYEMSAPGRFFYELPEKQSEITELLFHFTYNPWHLPF